MQIGSDYFAPASDYRRRTKPRSRRNARKSLYIAMRDGVKIAVDIHLPSDLGGERFPTIVRMTRYMRSFEINPWLARVAADTDVDPVNGSMRALLLSHGYAWVDVDVRGSGASFGCWRGPWAPDQVEDGRELLDFVIAQPWSNGVVGATGNSYDGTAAEFLMSTGHAALKAVVLRCCLFDTYTDVAYPGGLWHAWFTEAWQRMNSALDENRPEGLGGEAFSVAFPRLSDPRARRLLEAALHQVIESVRPVDADHDRALLGQALAEHAGNRDVHATAERCTYRDDPDPSDTSWTVGTFSPSSKRAELAASGAAVLGISGWFDASYAHSAIKRHLTLARPGDRLVLGPWNHCVRFNASPHARTRPTSFDLDAETLRFFDHHLKNVPTGLDAEPPVRFYEMGAEQWRAGAVWPPREARPSELHLGAEGTLSAALPEIAAQDSLAVDPDIGTGTRTRWRSLVSPFLVPDYADRDYRDGRSLSYVAPPLEAPVSITAGHPVATLFVRSTAPDAAIFVYLEEELPDGRVVYVTEGELRLSCRALSDDVAFYRSPAPSHSFLRDDAKPMEAGVFAEVVVELLPLSHRFRTGSRIRLRISGADGDHFAPVGPPGAVLDVAHGPNAPSRLALPVLGGPLPGGRR